MKKIILILVLGFSIFVGNSVFAEGELTPNFKDPNMNYDTINPALTPDFKDKNINYDTPTTEVEDPYDYGKLDDNTDAPATKEKENSQGNGIEVKVTEKIPGADCEGAPGAYTCTVKPGFGTVMQLMGGIIKYFTFLASLGGVLFIVINGLMLSMGGMGGNKDEIKKHITMTIGGLILLLLSGLILHSIAPWIYQ